MFDFIYKKKYKINTVAICGIDIDELIVSKKQIVYLNNKQTNSHLLSFNRDLNLIFTDISYRKSGFTEILYFKEDSKSLDIANKLKKYFDKVLISEVDGEYPSLNDFKKLKIKLIINLANKENVKEILVKFLEGI